MVNLGEEVVVVVLEGVGSQGSSAVGLDETDRFCELLCCRAQRCHFC